MATNKRVAANTAKVGAAIVAAWFAYEGMNLAPHIPTKGDVPTIGAGSTQYEDGTPVTMSDPPITRHRAEQLAVNLLEQQYGVCVRRSLGGALVHQVEFDQAVDFAGQYGCAAWGGSRMVRLMRLGDYEGACGAYIAYRFIADEKPHSGWTEYKPGRWKFDCATPGNRTCAGVWTRQLKRYTNCMGAQ